MTERANIKKKTELSDRTRVPRTATAKAQLSKRPATPAKGTVTKKVAQSTRISLRSVYTASGVESITMIRQGVPPVALNEIVRKMAISKERLYATQRFPTSTIDRKIRNNDALSAEYSERLLGLERLIGQVEVMLSQSGTGEKFDGNRWVGVWLNHPLPALGGARPADYMDTIEGQELVSGLLAQSQTGAYG